MVEYKILYSKLALKDAKKLSSANLAIKAKELIKLIRKNPFQNPPPYGATPQVRGQVTLRIFKHRFTKMKWY